MEIADQNNNNKDTEPSSPGLRSNISVLNSRVQSPKNMKHEEVKKYRISKYSVRNSFKKPEANINDLHQAKLRLTTRLGNTLIHKGGRAASNTNHSSKL